LFKNQILFKLWFYFKNQKINSPSSPANLHLSIDALRADDPLQLLALDNGVEVAEAFELEVLLEVVGDGILPFRKRVLEIGQFTFCCFSQSVTSNDTFMNSSPFWYFTKSYVYRGFNKENGENDFF
jgi:hypothetical protein